MDDVKFIIAVLCLVFTICFWRSSERWRMRGGDEGRGEKKKKSKQHGRKPSICQEVESQASHITRGADGDDSMAVHGQEVGQEMGEGEKDSAHKFARSLAAPLGSVFATVFAQVEGQVKLSDSRSWPPANEVAQLLEIVSRGFLLPCMGEVADEFVLDMSKTFSTLYKLSRKNAPCNERSRQSLATKIGNGELRSMEGRKATRGFTVFDEGDDGMVTLTASRVVAANGNVDAHHVKRSGADSRLEEERAEGVSESHQTDGHAGSHYGGHRDGRKERAVLQLEEEFAALRVNDKDGSDGPVVPTDALGMDGDDFKRKEVRWGLGRCQKRRGIVDADSQESNGGVSHIGADTSSPLVARKLGKDMVDDNGNGSNRTGDTEGVKGAEELGQAMVVLDRTGSLVSKVADVEGRTHAWHMEYLERSLAVKEESIALKYELVRMKNTELLLKREDAEKKERANNLHEEHNHLMRGKLDAKDRESKDKRKVEEIARLIRSCADELVAGLCVMCAALLYCCWKYGQESLFQQTSACQSFVEGMLAAKNKQTFSWWSKGVGYMFDGMIMEFRRALCQVVVAGRMILGFAILTPVAWLLLRQSVVPGAHDRPVTYLFLTLGVLCGYAGKLAVDSIGGSGLHWLLVWEVLCIMHIFCTCHAALVYRLLNGREAGEVRGRKASGKKDKGLSWKSFAGAFAVPPWIRRVVFQTLLVLILPLTASFLSFVPRGQLTAEIWKAAGGRKAMAAAQAFRRD